MKRDALISECGRYRYRLYREWSDLAEVPPVLWVMLNPSTADANIDDPTIRRCISFSKKWGYGSMWVGNLYALRSTDPSVLRAVTVREARGPENYSHLKAMAATASQIVCGWGNHGDASEHVFLRNLRPGGELWCLGTTKSGSPRHPLYVKGETPLELLL